MLRHFLWLHFANIATRFDFEILFIGFLQIHINLACKDTLPAKMFSRQMKTAKAREQIHEFKF